MGLLLRVFNICLIVVLLCLAIVLMIFDLRSARIIDRVGFARNAKLIQLDSHRHRLRLVTVVNYLKDEPLTWWREDPARFNAGFLPDFTGASPRRFVSMNYHRFGPLEQSAGVVEEFHSMSGSLLAAVTNPNVSRSGRFEHLSLRNTPSSPDPTATVHVDASDELDLNARPPAPEPPPPPSGYSLGFRVDSARLYTAPPAWDSSVPPPLTPLPAGVYSSPMSLARYFTATSVPHWPLTIALSVYPLTAFALATRRVIQKRRRRRNQLCPACGYDLRATPGRCPECGVGGRSDRDFTQTVV